MKYQLITLYNCDTINISGRNRLEILNTVKMAGPRYLHCAMLVFRVSFLSGCLHAHIFLSVKTVKHKKTLGK